MTFDYEYLNEYNGTRSPTGTVENDYTTRYFMRSLYQRLLSVIHFDLPETWNVQYFKNVLFKNGYIGVIPTEQYGVIPQVCTLSGYGLWMQPTKILVSQPLVKFEGTIGESCELIKLAPDYRGVWDIVEHYARQLSKAATSLNMSLENSRLSVLLGAKNKQAAETLKVIAEKVSAGDPVIIYDKKLSMEDNDITKESPIWSLAYNVKDNYITDKLLENIADILAQFDREIGIPAIENKKERMLTSEIDTLIADRSARLFTWAECLQESIDKVNGLFDLSLSFTTIAEEVQNDEPQPASNPDRDV